MYELNDKKIGEHLKELIDERGYKSTADFCRRYLIEKNNTVNYTEDNLNEDLKTAKNTFSKILSGKQSITLEQLPILSKLLCISCEEILSAGKKYAPTINHITNYEIAQSSDRNIWDEYMKREDKLFLNCDEYRKTVIDYALEFKNYGFIKYLLNEGFIWFIDPTPVGSTDYNYGAGTMIPPNDKAHEMRHPENYLTYELKYKDGLRTQTIALAMECGDYDILDSMRAREFPEMQLIDWYVKNDIDINKNRNEDMIQAIAMTESENVIKYFSEEFVIQSRTRTENTFIFPFLSDVVEIMLDNNNERYAETIIKELIAHNKKTYERINALIDETCQKEIRSIQDKKESIMKEAYHNGVTLADLKITFKTEKEVRHSILGWFSYNENNDIVSFYNGNKKGIATNIVKVNSKKGSHEIKKLIKELNEWYSKVISLGGE